ncbi:MAG: NADH:ubiquinone oxidoreductase subunit [Rickettsiales bacterium]|jgi:NADH:ubiquinone oxidoreductase subunit
MDLISRIAIKISCRQVGVDEFGNRYFEANKASKNQLRRKKRYVIYNGLAEPSKIPAQWHGWMHYTTDESPVNSHKASWQKIHLPNLTGTKFANFPAGSKKSEGKRNQVSSDYQAWKP